MKKNYLITLILTLCISAISFGQTVIILTVCHAIISNKKVLQIISELSTVSKHLFKYNQVTVNLRQKHLYEVLNQSICACNLTVLYINISYMMVILLVYHLPGKI